MNMSILVATILIEICFYFLGYASTIGNNMMSNRHRPRIVHYGNKTKRVRRK